MGKAEIGRIAVIAVAATTLVLGGCAVKGMDAEEWILKQRGAAEMLEAYCGELDDVVGIRIAGGMTDDEFRNEIEGLRSEFTAMYNAWEKDEIKPGTATEETKTGEEGIENAWKHIGDLSDALASDDSLFDERQLAYFYMGYQEALKKDFKDYYRAYLNAGGIIEDAASGSNSGTAPVEVD